MFARAARSALANARGAGWRAASATSPVRSRTGRGLRNPKRKVLHQWLSI
jgi:hypothetical protein